MEFDAVLLPSRRAASIAQGLWHDRTINDDLDACVAACPDQLALTAVRVANGSFAGDRRSFSYRELAALADRIAVGLTRLGVGRNDVVALQMPNWWQFTLTYLACSRIGAVLNPLMHIFRERELGFMLAHGEAKVLIVPKVFRGFDHEAMARALQPQLPALKHIVVVDGDGPDSFDALLAGPAWEQSPDAAEILNAGHRPGPDDITQLIYTSGTTGEPKGVMHTANTLMGNILPYAERLALTGQDVVLMASPMAHQTGFMYGLMMPIMLRGRVVLQDIWDAKQAIALIREQGVSFTMASTPFLADLTKGVAEGGLPVPTLKIFLCAGAPIPGALVEQARATLGTKIVSAWGMTENGAVTLIELDDDDERAINTDGSALPGVEVKVIDTDGSTLPAGQVGKLVVRACSNFGGYLKRPQWNNTDAQGWFDTGDLARLDERGYIRISGRSKDVIIRGGENIPVVEIEALLYKHPAVAQAAIVAYADERLGERACAVVVPKAGATLDLAGMIEFLKSHKVAPTYIPERLVLREAMPATPSGKIQKFRLRDMLRDGQLG
ncbi:MAG: cyclohexanecarboxylate-CoA ligase [Pseudomonadota bacterium]|jgi:cyclohexanecarboxylate-CoA ligase